MCSADGPPRAADHGAAGLHVDVERVPHPAGDGRDGPRTAPLGLSLFQGQHASGTTLLAAGAVLVALPIVVSTYSSSATSSRACSRARSRDEPTVERDGAGVTTRGVRRGRAGAVAIACVIAVAAASFAAPAAPPPARDGDVRGPARPLPPVAAGFDYQLGGAYRRRPASASSPATHRPAGAARRHLLRQRLPDPARTRGAGGNAITPACCCGRTGTLMHDPGWPGEMMLDTSTRQNGHGSPT